MKKTVLFLCTGNSCRSQMAEGLLKSLKGDSHEAHSAGINPSAVHPMAERVMKELGVDISGHYSKSADKFLQQSFDMIITVCDNAKESCPIFQGEAQKFHWNLEDPAEATGSEEERLNIFRKTRDKIINYIKELD